MHEIQDSVIMMRARHTDSTLCGAAGNHWNRYELVRKPYTRNRTRETPKRAQEEIHKTSEAPLDDHPLVVVRVRVQVVFLVGHVLVIAYTRRRT